MIAGSEDDDDDDDDDDDSKFNGTSTPKGSYSAKTGEPTRKECYGSTV